MTGTLLADATFLHIASRVAMGCLAIFGGCVIVAVLLLSPEHEG